MVLGSTTNVPLPRVPISISSLSIDSGFGNMVAALSPAASIAAEYITHQTPNITTTITPIIHLLNATSPEQCASMYENFITSDSGIFCNWTWDTMLCWPPTSAGTTVHQYCPPQQTFDTRNTTERRCGLDGRWEGKPDTALSEYPNGWTDFSTCLTPEFEKLYKLLGKHAKIKLDIAERTRTLEFVGLTISLFALLLSLLIFLNFRTLRNNRTRIHKNLFIAMVIQVIIRLTLYLDQAIIRKGPVVAGNNTRSGIDNTPYLCEASYIFLEYARTAMFLWMFIEGLYLHNVVTVTVFQGRFPHTIYSIVGWGSPIIMTAIWAAITATYRGQYNCWWGYNLTPYYWILEGPRLAVILLNFFFLLNIIRVLVVKLRQSHTSDIEQVRKAVRAAFVLLPLLGITNLLNMTESPLGKTVWEFALWSFITHFLTSFQGFFIAMIYCFLNGEVRAALVKSLNVYMSLRGHGDWAPRRASIFSAGYNTAPETEAPCNDSLNRQDSSPRQQKSKLNNGTRKWMMSLCFRSQQVLREPTATSAPPETNV